MSKHLPLLLLLLSMSAFAQTATYTTSFTGSIQTRSFTDYAGNYIITNADGRTTWFAYGPSEGWVDFYEGSCVGPKYISEPVPWTASTFDVVCDDGTTRTEIQGTFAETHYCRYGICIWNLKGTSSITAMPAELHALGVPGY